MSVIMGGMKNAKFVSIGLLEEVTGLSRSYLRELARNGQIPYLRAGSQRSRLMFCLDDVLAALVEMSKEGGADECQ